MLEFKASQRLKVPVIQGVCAKIIFGSVPAVVGAISVNLVTVGFVRLALAVFISSFTLLKVAELRAISNKQIKSLVLLGLCFALHWLFYFAAIKTGGAAIAALGETTYGIQLVLLGGLLRLNSIKLFDILAVIIAMAGAALALPEVSLTSNQTIGFLFGVLSGTFFAFLPIIHKKNMNIPVNLRTWGQFAFALPVFTVLLPWSDWHATYSDWLGLIYLGCIVTVIAHSLWARASTVLATTVTSVISYLYLPTAIFFSWVILDENISTEMILGSILILGANALTFWSHRPINE